MSEKDKQDSERLCVSRRQFMLTGASVVAMGMMPGIVGATGLMKKEYPRQGIIALNKLKKDQPVDFLYPPNLPGSMFFLVKLGEAAGGGIGPDNDIVAFSYQCPHMGGPLNGMYKANHKALGPCPLHLTSFDLTRHGMVITGHATESLPQASLEIHKGHIYATGVTGLIYGTEDNLMSVS